MIAQESPGEAPDEPTIFEQLRDEVSPGFSSHMHLLDPDIVQQPVESTLDPKNIRGISWQQMEPDFYQNFHSRVLSTAVTAQESPGEAPEEPTIFDKLRDEVIAGFSSHISLVGSSILQQPAESTLNPQNILEIPRYQLELDFRPDLYENFRALTLSVKPRLELSWRRWDDGIRQGDNDAKADAFVLEWLARYRLTNQVFVSYGRENLQWGPSYLLSSSNPFQRDNGQNRPKSEVRGLDYGRAVWVPSNTWTASFIANTDNAWIRDFHKTYAIKLDYTGEKKYFSLISSYREDNKLKLGFFGGWTVSDALLLHIEGSLPDPLNKAAILVGSAYTLEWGPTIGVEFFHDGNGCTLELIDLCFVPGFGTTRRTDVLIRQNYLLLQYVHARIRDTANLTLRWIHNFDDNSNRLIGVLEYDLGDRMQLFAIGNIDRGSRDAEFNLLNYSLKVGIRFTF